MDLHVVVVSLSLSPASIRNLGRWQHHEYTNSVKSFDWSALPIAAAVGVAWNCAKHERQKLQRLDHLAPIRRFEVPATVHHDLSHSDWEMFRSRRRLNVRSLLRQCVLRGMCTRWGRWARLCHGRRSYDPTRVQPMQATITEFGKARARHNSTSSRRIVLWWRQE